MDLAAAIEQFVDALVTKIAARLQTPKSAEYYDPEHLPPAVSRRWFVRNAPFIPGARKLGRSWVVEKSDFDAWVAKRVKTRTTKADRKMKQDAEDAADLARFGFKKR